MILFGLGIITGAVLAVIASWITIVVTWRDPF